MGTIIDRKRAAGVVRYNAQIVRKQSGKIVRREAKTFPTKTEARAWLKLREAELTTLPLAPFVAKNDVPLSVAIDRYISESKIEIGRTKQQVLRSIREFAIASLPCGEIASHHIVQFAEQLSNSRQPQTVGNYISHLSAIFRIAKPAWGYRLDQSAMSDAHIVLRRIGITSKSKQRDRRPTLHELEKLMSYFADRSKRKPDCVPMHVIIAFALFSTRRQDEIVRQKWFDADELNKRILVRDMKNPGGKKGNDVWCELPDEALAILRAVPRKTERIFPHSTDAIGTAFTRACRFLEIDDLHFHDLRHEGISRLFEIGRTIPQVASVSGHKSWQSLQRYAHVRQAGDKFTEWRWLPIVS